MPACLQATEQQGKIRGKPEKVTEHYTQASLFYVGQWAVEQADIAAAFRFELSKFTVPAIRKRVVSMLRNASGALAQRVAMGFGIERLPVAMPRALAHPAQPEYALSPALSLMARPGDVGVMAVKAALLIAPGVIGKSVVAALAKDARSLFCRNCSRLAMLRPACRVWPADAPLAIAS